MKKFTVISLIVILTLAIAAVSAVAASNNPRIYRAVMTGAGDNTDSTATGKAQFEFSKDGKTLRYRVVIKGLENTTQAHIHVAPTPGANGGVVLWLYPDAPPPVQIPGVFTGILGSRSVTSADLVGSLAGMTFDDLKAAILEGRAYVNVHTTLYPAGEIRGDIFPVNKGK
jgi:hypothetical protein